MDDKVVVTGAAGFIGSHLCEALVGEGFHVVGLDSFNPNYDIRVKRANLSSLAANRRFELVEGSINDIDLDAVLSDARTVFHLAAQAGVRDSWAKRFDEYIDSNIRATQVLCEACRGRRVDKFVYASSSSVYGDTAALPMNESHPTRPHSPYGVTKLAAEALCLLYKRNFGLPVAALRFFTVFGPRQRPDMAFHKFIAAALDGRPLRVYGDGTQTRDFTYVSDIVDANLRAMRYRGGESVFNIGGGNRIALSAALEVLAAGFGNRARPEIVFEDPVKGDVVNTYADISLAKRELGYAPRVGLEEGLAREIEWIESSRQSARTG